MDWSFSFPLFFSSLPSPNQAPIALRASNTGGSRSDPAVCLWPFVLSQANTRVQTFYQQMKQQEASVSATGDIFVSRHTLNAAKTHNLSKDAALSRFNKLSSKGSTFVSRPDASFAPLHVFYTALGNITELITELFLAFLQPTLPAPN